jgi:hypothetical protein
MTWCGPSEVSNLRHDAMQSKRDTQAWTSSLNAAASVTFPAGPELPFAYPDRSTPLHIIQLDDYFVLKNYLTARILFVMIMLFFSNRLRLKSAHRWRWSRRRPARRPQWAAAALHGALPTSSLIRPFVRRAKLLNRTILLFRNIK